MGYFLQLEYLLRDLKHRPDDISLAVVIAVRVLLVLSVFVFVFRKYFTFIVKSLGRNLLRTALTSGAIMILVFVVTLIWSFLVVLDVVMAEKSRDLKAIVTERWQIPSQMPFAYARDLEEGAPAKPSDVQVRPEDSMTWQFYGGSIDPANQTRENTLFFFAMDPRKIRPMMDDLDMVDPAVVQKMVENKQGVLLGREKLEAMNKRVGERIRVTSMNYKGIDLDFDIVGLLPEGRYNMSGIMNRDYLNDALDGYQRDHGEKHPLADKTLNLVWLRVPDSRAFQKVADQIMNSSKFTAPAVKCETASSGIAAWLEPYKDLLNGLKYLLVPTILVIMTMVIAIAISISIRERRTELAVLKVLGFGPVRILMLVLGEALLIGGGSGLLSGTLSYVVVHHLLGGIKFPVAFFPIFDIYADAIWWGLVFGTGTAFLGSIWSAWSARTIKVSEVFSKVA